MARNVEFNEELAISKAMDVFWKKGYSGASMRDLTDAMGISASSAYNTIGDKHQLFVKCIKYYTELRMEGAKKQLRNVVSPLKAIEKFINASVYTITNESDSCLAIKTTFEMAVCDLEVQKILKNDHDFTYQLILGLVENAIKKNEITISQDAKMLTDFIVNHFTGWHESFIIHHDKLRIKRMAGFLIEQLSK